MGFVLSAVFAVISVFQRCLCHHQLCTLVYPVSAVIGLFVFVLADIADSSSELSNTPIGSKIAASNSSNKPISGNGSNNENSATCYSISPLSYAYLIFLNRQNGGQAGRIDKRSLDRIKRTSRSQSELAKFCFQK